MATNVITTGTGGAGYYKTTSTGIVITPEIEAAAAAGPSIEEILADMDAEETE